MMRHNTFTDRTSGFTLLELMIVIAIIGILTAVAYPSYKEQVNKGYISDAHADLSNIVFNMEQLYQENRTYRDPLNANACAIADFTSDYFSFSCTSNSKATFTWTATSLAGALGSAGSFKYDIDQDGTKKTLAYDGSAVNKNEWVR